MSKYFKNIDNTVNISSWENKGLPNEVIKPPTTSDNNLAPTLKYTSKRMFAKFNGSCLEQDRITFNHGTIFNIDIVYDLKPTLNYNEDITLEICLFSTVKLTKNTNISKYKYFGYGIGFVGNNAIVFVVDMSSSIHADHQKTDFLILGDIPPQGLDGTTLTVEKICAIHFTATKKKLCLSLHYNGENSYLFVSGT